MNKASTLLDTNWQLAIGESKALKTIGNCKEIELTRDEVAQCDIALKDYKDLFHPDYAKWICKAFYSLGSGKFHQLARQAREGNNPAKLFTYLIKKNL